MANEVKHGRRLTPEEKLEHRKYRETVNAKVPKSKTFSQCILAFLTGGAICCIGQLIGDFGTGGIEPCGTGTRGVHFDRFDFHRRIAHGNRGLR